MNVCPDCNREFLGGLGGHRWSRRCAVDTAVLRRAEMVTALLRRDEYTAEAIASLSTRAKSDLARRLVRQRTIPAEVEQALREVTVVYQLGGEEALRGTYPKRLPEAEKDGVTLAAGSGS